MPWVRFTADYDWRINSRALIAYRAGKTCLVTQVCAREAIEKGKAVAVERPKRPVPQKDGRDAEQ